MSHDRIPAPDPPDISRNVFTKGHLSFIVTQQEGEVVSRDRPRTNNTFTMAHQPFGRDYTIISSL